jgi:AraC family transcriptional regulator
MVSRLEAGCLHGKVLKSLQVSDFILSETWHHAKSVLLKHSHSNPYFCFVLQGTYTELYGKKELTCNPSTLTFRSADEEHEDRFHDKDGRVFVVEIPPRWTEKLRENSLKLNSSNKFQNNLLFSLITKLNREFHYIDSASHLAIEGLTIEIIAEAARSSVSTVERREPDWLNRAVELLHSSFFDNLTLENIGLQVGVHPVHLATVFRQKFNCTVGEYTRRLKIEYACRQISSGELPLSEIALNAGFGDQSHFSKVFKRHIGMTPNEYKKIFSSNKFWT